jgi:hypothetical protein
MTTESKKGSSIDSPASVRDAQDPTFVEIGGARRGRATHAPPPSAASAYNPLAVERYEHSSFVDVTLEPVAASRKPSPTPQTATDPTSLSRGIHRALQLQHWKQRIDAALTGKGGRRLRRGFAGGAAIATLMGGLLLSGDGQRTASAQAAPSQTPPPPPKMTPPPPPVEPTGDAALDRLVERIGEDSPLWRFVEPGDGSPLWRLIERIGLESPVWESLKELDAEGLLWKHVRRIGPDAPLWDRLAPDGDTAGFSHLLNRLAEERAGRTRGERTPRGRNVPDGQFRERGDRATRHPHERGSDEPRVRRRERGSPSTDIGLRADGSGPLTRPAERFGERLPADSPLKAFGEGGLKSTPVHEPDAGADLPSTPQAIAEAAFAQQAFGVQGFTERLLRDDPLGNGIMYGPHPTFVDIDGDGDLDAFVGGYYYDRYCALPYGDYIFFYENVGSGPFNPIFVKRTGAYNPLSGVYGSYLPAPTFVDIDGDGDFDAFIGNKYGGVRFFQNMSVEYYSNVYNPTFVEQVGPYNPFYGVPWWTRPVPTFVDIDGDGDFDAFVGDKYGYYPYAYGAIRYFENLDDVYGYPFFVERYGAYNPLSGVGGYYHLELNPTFIDIDGDGDFDAFVGDSYFYQPYYYTYAYVRFFQNYAENYGGQPSFVEQYYASNPLYYVGGRYLFGTLAPAFADIEGDGDFDAFIGDYSTPIFTYVDDHVRHLKNAGTSHSPTFVERYGFFNPLSNRMRVPFPTFVDIDGDGDLDAFVGTDTFDYYYGYVYGIYDFGALRYFENLEDTYGYPFFVERRGPTYNPAYGIWGYSYSPYAYWRLFAPTFVDIDGDGDYDLFIGDSYYDGYTYTYQGYLRFFENYAENYGGLPAFVEQTGPAHPFYGTTWYWAIAPTFVDINGDGDFDAFIGDGYYYYPYQYGIVRYFENQGNPYNPSFVEQFGYYHPMYFWSYSPYIVTPTFADIDGDGDYDALVGDYGYVRAFENLAENYGGLPLLVERYGYYDNPLYSFYAYSWLVAPTLVDIDGDGDFDAFIGVDYYNYGPAAYYGFPNTNDVRFLENVLYHTYLPLVLRNH